MIGVIAFAQIPGIPRGVPNIFGKEEPIATSLADAVTEVEFLDNFNPENTAPLSILPRGSNNEFRVNKPGRYVFLSQSYCLRAGAFGPGSGDGSEGLHPHPGVQRGRLLEPHAGPAVPRAGDARLLTGTRRVPKGSRAAPCLGLDWSAAHWALNIKPGNCSIPTTPSVGGHVM